MLFPMLLNSSTKNHCLPVAFRTESKPLSGSGLCLTCTHCSTRLHSAFQVHWRTCFLHGQVVQFHTLSFANTISFPGILFSTSSSRQFLSGEIPPQAAWHVRIFAAIRPCAHMPLITLTVLRCSVVACSGAGGEWGLLCAHGWSCMKYWSDAGWDTYRKYYELVSVIHEETGESEGKL